MNSVGKVERERATAAEPDDIDNFVAFSEVPLEFFVGLLDSLLTSGAK
jgi:hypothetical protein